MFNSGNGQKKERGNSECYTWTDGKQYKWKYRRVRPEMPQTIPDFLRDKLVLLAKKTNIPVVFCVWGDWDTWKNGYWYPCDRNKKEALGGWNRPAFRYKSN